MPFILTAKDNPNNPDEHTHVWMGEIQGWRPLETVPVDKSRKYANTRTLHEALFKARVYNLTAQNNNISDQADFSYLEVPTSYNIL